MMLLLLFIYFENNYRNLARLPLRTLCSRLRRGWRCPLAEGGERVEGSEWVGREGEGVYWVRNGTQKQTYSWQRKEKRTIYIYIYIYIYMYILIYLYMYEYICVHTYTYIYTDIHIFIQTDIHTHTQTHTHTRTHTHRTSCRGDFEYCSPRSTPTLATY